ncbi:COG2605 Predicted kinase related to galactokinase and mevalonate kinase [Candidatus Methylopumilus universalis]|uniref:GHMP family kinase ATP-binding protein n=1 Tax=Candidatus Methylopumilus universalis TaxID=2588536 RepID=UPI003BEF1FD3
MIIARSPLRISLGGGGTDLPSYYREHEGFLIAAAIDKYVYVTINRPFNEGIYLKYSEIEHVKTVDEVSHNIIREALKLENLNTPQVEISSIADLPSGTGLGSSGSFTTALLKALYAYRHRHINPEELAELACAIEIDRLKEPIGKQDQYIASVGGITCFAFHKDNSVTFAPLKISRETFHKLEDNLLLFFTGFSRSASEILKDQHIKSQKNDVDMLNNLHFVKEIGYLSKDALESGNTDKFGELMHQHWEHKKKRSGGMSNQDIDTWYETALKNGAIGGKVVGAGGGGFLMFMADDAAKLRTAMTKSGLQEVRFKFDFEGAKVIHT